MSFGTLLRHVHLYMPLLLAQCSHTPHSGDVIRSLLSPLEPGEKCLCYPSVKTTFLQAMYVRLRATVDSALHPCGDDNIGGGGGGGDNIRGRFMFIGFWQLCVCTSQSLCLVSTPPSVSPPPCM